MEELLLDPLDVALLAQLQRDSHATNQHIGDRLNLSASQVSRRTQRLESLGVIRAYVALLEPTLLSLHVRAFTYVTLARHGGEEGQAFEQAVREVPEVLDCYAIAGEADYLLQIVAASLGELSQSVLQRLTRLPGVVNVRSSIVLNRIKATTELPLDHLARGAGLPRRVRLVQRPA
ncbi:MAG: Lrp/AsnC family transcriptional regulator [Burkholderiales bacterium]|nr:Lrp/AsnC family transcriptional regulator [Burkholderiales bacterium]